MSESSSVGQTRKIPANQPRSKPPPSQLRQGQTAHRPSPSSPVKQLFDPSRDDPFRFSVLSRQQATVPAPPLSTSTVGNDYVSASSTSDTRSLASSAFTLSSVTSASSVDSGPRFSPNRSEEPASVNPFVAELKRVYREISSMEKRLLSEDHPVDATEDEPIRVQGLSESPNEKWVRLIEAHKE
jgi:protein SMG6